MSIKHTPAEQLLCALRRLAGDAPSSHRFKPAEWFDLSTKLNFTEAQRKEAIASLRTSGFIAFNPESAQIIALTLSGISIADQLILRLQSREVSDPMPETLEEIRADLNFWELRLFDGEPGSPWWEQVHARINGMQLNFQNPREGFERLGEVFLVDQIAHQGSYDGVEKPHLALGSFFEEIFRRSSIGRVAHI
jgi:hypothetical protein